MVFIYNNIYHYYTSLQRFMSLVLQLQTLAKAIDTVCGFKYEQRVPIEMYAQLKDWSEGVTDTV